MDSRNYVKQPNLAGLALAARMRVDQGKRYDLVREFALTVTSAPARDEERKEVVDFFSSYQELETEEALKLADELGRVQPEELRERIMASTNPWVKVGIHKGIAQGIEKGIAQGREQGRQEGLKEGEAELVLRLLARRFGRVTPNQRAAIRKLDLERLGALGEALLDFRSAADLTSWLRKN